MRIEQDQVLDDHSAQGQQLRPLQTFDGHIHPPLQAVLQQPLERLNGFRAQFMEHLAYCGATSAAASRRSHVRRRGKRHCAPSRGRNCWGSGAS